MEIYDRLLQFTLFQGMSSADLMQVAGHTKFGFNKLNTGKRLVSEGTPCTHLIFLTSGTLGIESRNDSHTWQKTCTSLGHIGGCSVTCRITMAARVFSTRTASAAQAALTSRLRRSFSHFAFFTDLTSSKRLPAQTDPAGFPAR